ncbi:HNH endonuclease signature motif containing protein [Streptomyces sp. NPDC056159]|uniref:HNH endonuclease n=1 Tax=Streptomyces sp. NPDC056159 TaxID=3155537 RepID=UPI003437F6B9
MCPRHRALYPLGTSCPKCNSARPRRHQSKSATARGYTYQWEKIRAIAIRQQPYCSFCGTDKDLTGDHIHPLKEGGQNVIENVRVLCRSCNTRRENDLRKGKRY